MKRLFWLLALVLIPNIAEAQTRFVSATPTLDTAAYADGDSMHTAAMTFTRALKGSSKTGYVISAIISDNAGQNVDVELWLFTTLPTSYGAANAAFDPTDAHMLTYLGTILFDDANRFVANDNAGYLVGSIVLPVTTTNQDGNLYGVLRAKGAYDGDADSITVTLGISQD